MRSGWMGEGMDNWQTSELKTGLDECKGKAGRSGSRVDGKVMTKPGHKRRRGRVEKLWNKSWGHERMRDYPTVHGNGSNLEA
jgi:hypothetical protein